MTKKFESHDFSATAPTLKRFFTDPILNLIPETVSPNALTLFGGCAAGVTAFMLWMSEWMLDPETTRGKLLLIIGALLLVVYAVCDQLDGLQARRLKRGGPAGDFLDHWVDALLANLIPIGLMNFMIYDFYFTLCMTIVVSMAFWANNWETRNENERKLPFLGGLEFIWVGVVCLIMTAIWGKALWGFQILGIELRHAFYAIVISTLVFSALKNIYRARDKLTEIATPLISFGSIALYLIIKHEQNDLTWSAHYLALLTIGLMGVKHTGDQMRQLWLGTEVKSVEVLFVLPGLVLLALLFLKSQTPELAGTEFAVLLLFVLLCVWQLCFQSVNTFTLLFERFTQPLLNRAQAPRRIMVDMSATLLHHGHIRLLEQAKELGHVVVGLTSDDDLKSIKKLDTELSFDERREILLALSSVDEVVQTPWLLTNDVLDEHNIDLLVHGDDNQNHIAKERLVIFPRTEGVSSELMRKRAAENIQPTNTTA